MTERVCGDCGVRIPPDRLIGLCDDCRRPWPGAHDPGEVPAAGGPRVAQVVYALRDLGVEGRATAADVLAAAGGAGLTQRSSRRCWTESTWPSWSRRTSR